MKYEESTNLRLFENTIFLSKDLKKTDSFLVISDEKNNFSKDEKNKNNI